jgi:hypothetical protein
VSDCSKHRLKRLPKGVRIITSEQHTRAFGEAISRFRLFLRAESTIDLHSSTLDGEDTDSVDLEAPDVEYESDE